MDTRRSNQNSQQLKTPRVRATAGWYYTETTAMMAGCCAKLGLVDRARHLVAQCLAIQPDATVGYLVARTLFKAEGDREHLAECLRLAGMPE
jgi:hypothetical protein